MASPRANGYNETGGNSMHRQPGATSGRAFVRPDRHQMAGSIINIVKGPHRWGSWLCLHMTPLIRGLSRSRVQTHLTLGSQFFFFLAFSSLQQSVLVICQCA